MAYILLQHIFLLYIFANAPAGCKQNTVVVPRFFLWNSTSSSSSFNTFHYTNLPLSFYISLELVWSVIISQSHPNTITAKYNLLDLILLRFLKNAIWKSVLVVLLKIMKRFTHVCFISGPTFFCLVDDYCI